MFERFTAQARQVVVDAHQEARELDNPRIGTEHLLLALLSPDAGIAHSVLHGAGLDRARVRADIRRLVRPSSSVALGAGDAAALQEIGIDLDAVRSRIEEVFGPGALDPPRLPSRRRLLRRWRHRDSLKISPRARKVLELSLREALRLRHHHIGTEHILLGLLREGNGLGALILTRAGLTPDPLRRETLAALEKAA